MTRRWETLFSQAREWLLESRENPEGRKVLLLAVLALLAWVAGFFLLYRQSDMASRVPLQASRFASLVEVTRAYRALPPSQRTGEKEATAGDPLSSASEAIGRLQMKNRLKNLSSTNRGVSLVLEGLGQEELFALARELQRARLAVISAEIRALPVGGKRMLTVNLLLGGSS